MTSVLIVLIIAIASFVLSSVGFFLTLSMLRANPHHKAHPRASK